MADQVSDLFTLVQYVLQTFSNILGPTELFLATTKKCNTD